MDEFLKVLWKSIVVFILLIVLTRVIGRKLLSHLSFFDYVIGITIGTITGSYVAQEIKGMWVLISPLVLTCITILFGYINMKSLKLRKITEGEPVIVIHNGKILEKSLMKLRYHVNDLEKQLRDKGILTWEK